MEGPHDLAQSLRSFFQVSLLSRMREHMDEEDCEPLLCPVGEVSPPPSYGSPSESECEDFGDDPARQHTIQNPSSMDELSNSLSVAESRSLQEKSAQVRQHLISDSETFVHFVKCNIGTGILGLPEAIKHSGLVLGPISLALMAGVSVWCIYLLIHCAHTLSQRSNLKALDYGDVAYVATVPYSGRWATRFRRTVNVFLFITQFGFCCVYIVFIAANLMQIFEACFGTSTNCDNDNSTRIVIAVILIPLILLTFVRNLDLLAPLSGIANISLAFGLFVILYYCYSHLNTSSIEHLPLVAPVSDWPLFFGTVMFSFEAIGMVLPLENKMKKPRHFNRVLFSSMTLVTMLYVVFSVSGYLCFRENIKGSVTLNLPIDGNSNWIYSVVKLYLVFAIFTSYALQFYVPVNILEPLMLAWFQRGRRNFHPKLVKLLPYILRVIAVLGTAALAVSYPHIDLFISLVGAASSSSLALIFPPIIYILTFHNQQAYRVRVTKVLCVAVAVFGIIGFIFGSYSSLDGIVKHFIDGHKTSEC